MPVKHGAMRACSLAQMWLKTRDHCSFLPRRANFVYYALPPIFCMHPFQVGIERDSQPVRHVAVEWKERVPLLFAHIVFLDVLRLLACCVPAPNVGKPVQLNLVHGRVDHGNLEKHDPTSWIHCLQSCTHWCFRFSVHLHGTYFLPMASNQVGLSTSRTVDWSDRSPSFASSRLPIGRPSPPANPPSRLGLLSSLHQSDASIDPGRGLLSTTSPHHTTNLATIAHHAQEWPPSWRNKRASTHPKGRAGRLGGVETSKHVQHPSVCKQPPPRRRWNGTKSPKSSTKPRR